MMEEVMRECCGPEGKPDFEKMKKFMEKCGKTQFGEQEIRMMASDLIDGVRKRDLRSLCLILWMFSPPSRPQTS